MNKVCLNCYYYFQHPKKEHKTRRFSRTRIASCRNDEVKKYYVTELNSCNKWKALEDKD